MAPCLGNNLPQPDNQHTVTVDTLLPWKPNNVHQTFQKHSCRVGVLGVVRRVRNLPTLDFESLGTEFVVKQQIVAAPWLTGLLKIPRNPVILEISV